MSRRQWGFLSACFLLLTLSATTTAHHGNLGVAQDRTSAAVDEDDEIPELPQIGLPDDPGFEGWVTMEQVNAAWQQLDSRLLTDFALRLSQGEKTLRRAHQSLPAATLLNAAAKVASQKGDAESLDRLSAEAKETGRNEIVGTIDNLRKLANPKRSAAGFEGIKVEDASVEELAQISVVQESIDAAELSGRVDYLDAADEQIKEFPDLLRAEWRAIAKKLLANAREEVSKREKSDDRTIAVMDQLAANSRSLISAEPWQRLNEIQAGLQQVEVRIKLLEGPKGLKLPNREVLLKAAKAERSRLQAALNKAKQQVLRGGR